MQELINKIEEDQKRTDLPEFSPGDTITVHYLISEGGKERSQPFRGIVIKENGTGMNYTFTVRKVSEGVGVERIFPYHSPLIKSIEVNKRGKVRRSKLFYLRNRSAKKVRIKERRT